MAAVWATLCLAALLGVRCAAEPADCETYATPTCFRRYSVAEGHYYDCHSSDTDEVSWSAGASGQQRYGHASASLRVDGVDKLVAFGGVYETGVGVLVSLASTHEYDPAADSWRELSVNSTGDGVPSARYHAASWAWRDRLYVHGGYNGTHAADTWRADLLNATAGEWRLVPSSGTPAGRSGHTATPLSMGYGNQTLVVLFGGMLDDATPSQQLYVGTLSDLAPEETTVVTNASTNATTTTVAASGESRIAWTAMTAAGSAPAARAYHAAVAISDSCLLFYGGYNATTDTILGDLWELCAGPWTWTELSPGGTVPTTRFGHAALVASPGRMLISGGSSLFPNQYMDTVDEYDWHADRWLGTASADAIDGRRHHAMALVGNAVVVYGGVDKYETLADVQTTTYGSPMCDAGNGTDYCSALDSLICTPCAVGYYAGVEDPACLACATGSYADAAGAGACTLCAAGTYNENEGSTTSGDCVACAGGTYSTAVGAASAGTCENCAAGSISEASSGSTGCDTCSAGKYAPEQSTSCEDCSKGEYSAAGAGQCSACAAGTYGPYTGMDACYACPSGQWSYNASESCEYCGTGTYSSSPRGESPDVCEACPTGRYGDLEGLSSCTECPAGTYVNATGSDHVDSCESCPLGSYSGVGSVACDDCARGTFGNRTGATYCFECPVNTYLDYTGAETDSECVSCPAGSFTETAGAGDSSECVSCQAGSFTLPLELGGGCWPCPAGTYTASDTEASMNNCTTCPPMTTSALSEGSTECTACSGDGFSNEGWGTCTPCDNSTCLAGPNGQACSGVGACIYGLCECEAGFSGYDCATGTCATCYGVVYVDTADVVVSGVEGDSFDIVVARGVGTQGAVSVTMSVAAGNATVGSDYSASFPLTVSFTDGETSQTVSVPVLNDDEEDEGCEWLQLELSAPTGGATIGDNAVSDVYIDESKFSSELLSSSAADGSSVSPTDVSILLGTASALSLMVFVTRPTAAEELPLDLVILNDISGTFSDDMVTVRTLTPTLVASMQELYQDPYFGVTTFCDKPISPFGSDVSGDQSYQTWLALTPNTVEVQDTVDSIVTTSGRDLPESQLEGLFHAAIRTEEVGWRDSSRKVIVMTTDAEYHVAGDFSSAGENNLDAVLDGDPAGTGEDYPSEENVRDILLAKNIVPIFCATSSALADYEALVSYFGFGRAVELTSDSSNLVDLIVEALDEIDGEITLITETDSEGYVDAITPTLRSGVVEGQTVNFTVDFRAATAGEPSATVVLNAVGYDFVTVDVQRELNSCDAVEAEAPQVDDSVWLGWMAAVDHAIYSAELAAGHPGTFSAELTGDLDVASGVTGPFGEEVTVLAGTYGTWTQTVDVDHQNVMPLVVRGFSQSVGASVGHQHEYALRLSVAYQNGRSNDSVVSAPFSTADDGWDLAWAKLEPEYAIANVTVEAIFAGSATSVEFYGIGLFSSLDEACLCDQGYYLNARGKCSRCAAGFACSAGAHVQCTGDTFSFGGATACEDCYAGWVCEEGQTSPCPDLTYESAGSCLDCEEGYRCVDGQRYICPAGKWAPASADYCIPCDPGYISDSDGASTCDPCDAGTTSNHMRDHCVDCPAGEYSGVGQHPCVSCDPGYYATGGASDCEPCPEGTWAAGHANYECTACPEGTTSALGSSSEAACF